MLEPSSLRILTSSVVLAAISCCACGPAAAPRGSRAPNVVVFRGMCDASGAVELGGARFAVGDDEDNLLRIYESDRGGEPLDILDVSPALDLPVKKKTPEADIEAATRIGERALWLTSHGLNSKGEFQPSRFRFFATTAPTERAPLTSVGVAYHGLLQDLIEAPGLARYELAQAITLPPKRGGMNIEGMARGSDQHSVLLGLRSPLFDRRALVVPLLNPLQLVAAGNTQRALFGPARLLDLNGLGVRALLAWRGQYLVVAGALDREASSRLYLWDGADHVQLVHDVSLDGFNPEAIVGRAEDTRVLLLSDDGTHELDGVPCKKLKDRSRKQFRGLWVELPNPAPHE